MDEPGRREDDGLADQHGLAAQDSGPGPGSAGELTHRDVVVAAPPCGDGQAYTSLLDLTLLTGATLVAAPLPLVTAAMRVYKGTAAIVPRGTHVPGLPPDRVFPVALSPMARSRLLTSPLCIVTGRSATRPTGPETRRAVRTIEPTGQT